MNRLLQNLIGYTPSIHNWKGIDTAFFAEFEEHTCFFSLGNYWSFVFSLVANLFVFFFVSESVSWSLRTSLSFTFLHILICTLPFSLSLRSCLSGMKMINRLAQNYAQVARAASAGYLYPFYLTLTPHITITMTSLGLLQSCERTNLTQVYGRT